MSDYDPPKSFGTMMYPVHAENVSGLLKRVEPLLTPALLRSRFLKGILERLPAGVTFSDDDLKDKINIAINELELELKAPIFAETFRDKLPFDWNLYKSYIHLRVPHGPVISVSDLSIRSASNDSIFQLPPEWIESALFNQRQINVIPLLAAYGINSVTGSQFKGAGVAFLTALGGLSFVPSYWSVTYKAGLCQTDGQVPVVVNTLIGVYAAMDILSMVGPNNVNNSVSLGADGISQSSSGPGNALFQLRLNELEKKKQQMLGQLRRIFSQKIFMTNI